jgi:hypothetical protein
VILSNGIIVHDVLGRPPALIVFNTTNVRLIHSKLFT